MIRSFFARCGMVAAVLLLAACGRGVTSTPGDAPNLEKWVESERARPAQPLEPLPVMQQFETFEYSAQGMRDPFTDAPAVRQRHLVQRQLAAALARGAQRGDRIAGGAQAVEAGGLQHVRQMKARVRAARQPGLHQRFVHTVGAQQETPEQPAPEAQAAVARADLHAVAHLFDAGLQLSGQDPGGTQGDVRLGTWQTESQTRSVQQVQVLNGGRARLFVGRSQPYTVWQWAYAPAQAPRHRPHHPGGHMPPVQVWGQTEWLDLGQGLNVRPRWPGGQAPVTVELEASASQQSAYEPDGQIRHSEVASTVSVPLGEWTVVARSGRRAQSTRSGTLSTDTIDDTQSEQLAIRISAP